MKKMTYSAPTVKKAFKILQLISESATGLGVSDLAKRLKIGKSTVHGITYALEDLGVLIREPHNKKYTMGYTLLELYKRSYGKKELREVAKRPMEMLMKRVGETVFLGVLNGDHVTILDVLESNNEMKITAPPGTRLPLLVGATGRVLLAQLEREKARDIVQKKGLTSYTQRSVTDPKVFLREVDEAGERGYSFDNEEYIPGVRAVAAPLRMTSLPPAAIWVVGFTSTMDEKKIELMIREIRETATEISRSLEDNAGGIRI